MIGPLTRFVAAAAQVGEAIKRILPQMAPQALENIDSAPGKGMAPEGCGAHDQASAGGEAFLPTGGPGRREDNAIGLRMARRKRLKTLIPRPEMAWPGTAPTHEISCSDAPRRRAPVLRAPLAGPRRRAIPA